MVSSRPDHELYSRRRVRSGGASKVAKVEEGTWDVVGQRRSVCNRSARVTQRLKWHRWVTTRRTGSRIAGPHLVFTWDGEAEQSDDHKSDDDEPAYSDDNKSGDDEPESSDDHKSDDDEPAYSDDNKSGDTKPENSDDHKSDDDEPAYSDDNKSGDDEPENSDDDKSDDDDEFLQEWRPEASAITIDTRYDDVDDEGMDGVVTGQTRCFHVEVQLLITVCVRNATFGFKWSIGITYQRVSH